MALSERLALLITANVDDAVKGFNKVGSAADKQLGKAENKLEKTGTQMTRLGVGATALGIVGAVGLYKLGQSASDLNEVASQSTQIFGEAQGKIEDFAKGAAQSLGQSEKSAREGANTFGLFFTNAGKSADEAARMSIELTTLASDFASFKNTSPEEAIESIGAALRGESEPIRKYGVLLDDATLKNRALSLGLISTASGVLPPAIKQQAAYAEIIAQSSTIQGDFTRTSAGAANQQRILTAQLENLKAGIGKGVLPTMTQLVSLANRAAESFQKLSPATQEAVGKVSAYGSAALVGAGLTSSLVGQVIKAQTNFGRVADKVGDAVFALRYYAQTADKAKIAQGGLFGAAAVAGVALYVKSINDAANAQKNIKGDLDDVAARLRELGSTGKTTGINVEDLADSFKQLDKSSKNPSIGDAVKAFFKGERAVSELTAANRAARSDIDKLDGSLASLVANGHVDEARAAFRSLQAGLEKQGISQKDIVSGFGDYNKALGVHVRNLKADAAASGEVSERTASLANTLTPAGEAARKAGEGVEGLRYAAYLAGPTFLEFSKAIDVTGANAKVAADSFDVFKDAVDRALGKTFDVQEATDNLQTSLNAIGEEAFKSGAKFSGASDQAIDFRKSQQEIVEGTAAVLTAMAENGASADEVKQRQAELATQYLLTAEAAGVPKDIALLYAAAIRNIPTTAYTYFKADTTDAEAAIARLNRAFADVGRNRAAVVQANFTPEHRAMGGPVRKGKGYIVGEHGPEPFFPTQSGMVLPNSSLRAASSGGGNTYITNHNSFVIDGSTSPQATVDAIARHERAMAGASASAG